MAHACRPSRVREMTASEVAWIAGFLEGEGSFTASARQRGSVYVRIQASSTDRDVLERVAAIVGVGTVRVVRPDPRGSRKQVWIWGIGAKPDARELALQVQPWLGKRRRSQAQAVLDATATLPIQPVGTCLNGHRIEGMNRLGRGACRQCNRVAKRRARLRPQARP